MQALDILVNNAAITRDNIFVRLSDEAWDEVIAVNLTASFRLARAAVRGMMRRRYGRIIGITSVVGITGNAGQGNYAAAKAGMIGMSKALAREVAPRQVTVNCIAPGFIDTPMTAALNEKQRGALLATDARFKGCGDRPPALRRAGQGRRSMITGAPVGLGHRVCGALTHARAAYHSMRSALVTHDLTAPHGFGVAWPTEPFANVRG
jgi:NAD(P)-dependent dehydrogenase (short-subunit alcohol dehydrogenase family)